MSENVNLLSAKEAAVRLGISRPTLSRLVRDNKIGVYRVGVRTLFDEKILEEFKNSIFQPARETASRRRAEAA